MDRGEAPAGAMANDLLNPPETDALGSRNGHTGGATNTQNPQFTTGSEGHELDAFLGKAFEEKSVWADLYENVIDAFFPPKLPPLELTSTPIPVPDRMAVKRSPASIAISVLVNCGILALLLFAFRNEVIKVIPPKLLGNVDVSAWKPITPKSGKIGGGGGGGAHDVVPANKGHLPQIQKNPIVQPTPVQLDKPKIPIQAAIDVQQNIKLPDNPNLPLVGVTNSPNVTLASSGPGSGSGMGGGSNGGLGTGNGNGFGPGTGGNVGGGLRRVGDGVSPPRAIFQPEAEFSDEARRAKYEGTVVVTLIVDANGNPQNVHVTRTLGMGLDEKAVEAVQKYKFKPAMDERTGKPVPVMVSVEVRFRLY
jgi:periplasmic protein TonB